MNVNIRLRTDRIAKVALGIVATVLLVAGVLFAAPARAIARSYEMTGVIIDATIREDGTLEVTEDRIFDFDGSFNGVYWDLSRDGGNYEDLDIEVVSIGQVNNGAFEEFTLVDSASVGDNGVCTIENTYSSGHPIVRATLYRPQSDTIVTYRVVYRINGVVHRFEDMAQLYWKFVADGWNEPSYHVKCTVHLPVPAGESVRAGENVRLYAHGPLNGNINAEGNDAVATVPMVGTEEFAEIRILFPESWVPSMQSTSGEIE